MMDLSECLTEDSEILLIGTKRKKGDKNQTKIFWKDFNHAEFIGEELCAIHNIRCAHYFIVGLGGFDLKKISYYGDINPNEYEFKIAANDFRRPNRVYYYLRQYKIDKHFNKFEKMLEKTKDDSNKAKLCKEMLQLLALDIYMGQVDRYDENIMFEVKQDNSIRLAPLYDFERSLKQNYLGYETIYESELYSFPNIEACKNFIEKYPLFRDILSSYLTIDLKEVIERAYNRRGLIIPDSKWTFYDDFDGERKKILEKIIN